MKDSLTNIVTLDAKHSTPEERAFYVNHIIDFRTKKGDQDVFDFMEAYANQILGRDTVESIFKTGKNVSQYLKEKRQAGDFTIRDIDGRIVHEYQVGNNTFTLSEDESSLLARKFGNQYEEGEYGFDSEGNYVLKNGTSTFTNGGETLIFTVRDARVVAVDMTSAGGESVRFYGTDEQPLVLIHDNKSAFKVHSGVMRNWNTGETFLYQNGQLSATRNTQIIDYTSSAGDFAAGMIQMVQQFNPDGVAFAYEIHMDQGLGQELITGNQSAAQSFWNEAIENQPVPNTPNNFVSWIEAIDLKRHELADDADQAVDKVFDYIKPFYEELKQINPLLYNDLSLELLRITIKGFIDTVRIFDRFDEIYDESGELKNNWKELTLPERTQKMLSIGDHALTEIFRGLNVLMIGGAIKSIGKAATGTAIRSIEELTGREVIEEVGYLLRQNTDEASSILTKLFKNPATKEQALRAVGSLEDSNEVIELLKRGLISVDDLARIPFKTGTNLEKLVEAAQLQHKLTGKTTTVIGRFVGGTEKYIGNKNLNVLSFDSKDLTQEEIWAINKAWLDDAIARGDDILLISETASSGSFFEKELTYLAEKGFRRVGNFLKKIQ